MGAYRSRDPMADRVSDDGRVINRIVHVIRNGSGWRDVSEVLRHKTLSSALSVRALHRPEVPEIAVLRAAAQSFPTSIVIPEFPRDHGNSSNVVFPHWFGNSARSARRP